MYEWILPSLREILATSKTNNNKCSSAKAEQQWRVSLAATEHLLLKTLTPNTADKIQGLVLTAPAPLFCQPELNQSLRTVTFTAKPFNPLALMPFNMSSRMTQSIGNHVTSHLEDCTQIADSFCINHQINHQINIDESILPLLTADPLGTEQFCLVFTEKFRLVLVLATNQNGKKEFLFSFAPEVVQQAWHALGARVVLTNPDLFADLDQLVTEYPSTAPNYQTIIEFSQFLLQELPEPETDKVIHNFSQPTTNVSPSISPSTKSISRPDVELLQAFAHEVRTPLATIRTLTRLLLKRQDLPTTVINRLQVIDHECTDQIDRMELLFKAAELETCTATKSANTQLTPMSLDQVLQQSIPRWQQAATRRNLTLDVAVPQQLPTVVSNPNMLDRVLTGLMENFTRSLPPGSSIQVQIMRAGDQLKLQLSPQLDCHDTNTIFSSPTRKSLGQLLVFQPETGTISLNISATKHLFQAIGGKLIVRQNSQSGEVLTIFLPLEVSCQHKDQKVKIL
ncbi:MAG: sensor histidine kinase [Nostocales cyanobacterium]|nr:MAG: sensor histidine kinase [Nostocales cyanobacterium]TAF12982.1 MAG: sensor histidine kinase [Nostocales cyanobacterium]